MILYGLKRFYIFLKGSTYKDVYKNIWCSLFSHLQN